MKEITCPKCGTVIKVDDAAYAEILSQVKSDVVREEVESRIASMRKVQEAEAKAKEAKDAEKAAKEANLHQEELSRKDMEIERLRQQLEGFEEKKGIELKAMEEKKGLELKAMEEKLAGWEKSKSMEIEAIRLQEKEAAAGQLRAKEVELLKKGEEINALIAQASKDKELAAERINGLNEAHKKEVESLEKEVQVYKDFKARRSVKLLGEDLEQHCYAQYNQLLLPIMPSCTFEKDNEAIKEEGEEKGTKGDFIFRAKDNDTEYLSIMFEMKNEADVTSNKHKNAHFFDKLDKDRKKKNCEYAVLVSMLEMDNDMYNGGITVVPGYEKMYVVRPDNFISIITLLVQTSRKSLEARQALEEAKSMQIDVTNFEAKLLDFQKGFSKNIFDAKNRYDDAIKGIDTAIKTLNTIKDNLTVSYNHLLSADNKAQKLSVRGLTRGNETMKKAFKDAREKNAEAQELLEPEEQ